MAADGKHGVGQAAEIIGVYQEMGYAIVGLQKTRRSGQSALLQARYYVAYCSGESGGDGEGNKSHGGLGLAVRKSIFCAEARSETVIEDHLKVVTPSGSSICGDRRMGCASARAQAAEAEMAGKRQGRSRNNLGDDCETSRLEAAEGWHAGQPAKESCPARKHPRSQGLRRCLRKVPWKIPPGSGGGFAPG